MNELTAAPTDQPVTFRLWGAVEAYANGKRLPMGTQREQAMLAGLIAAKGRKVQRETLKTWIWDDEPESAPNELTGFMTNLRRRLRELGFDGALDNGRGLCRLDIPETSVDVHRAKALFMAKKHSDDHAATLLGQALRLCEGEPLAGLTSRRITSYRMELEKQRHALRIAYYQAVVRLGRHQEHIGELSRLFDEHPDDTAVTALTMCAHYFAGSGTDARDVYTRHQSHVRNEIGVDVAPQIEDLHSRVLGNNLAKDTCSFALGKPYSATGGYSMDTDQPLLMAVRPDTGSPEETQRAAAESFGELQFQTRLAGDCLIFVVPPEVTPAQVVSGWMDTLHKAVRQRVQVGIAAGSEDDVCELARSDYARRVLNGAPNSNLVVAVSDDVYELVTSLPDSQIHATGYRQTESGVSGWVRVPGLSIPPHPRDDRPEHDSPVSTSSGPNVVFQGKTRIGKQTIVSTIKKARW